MIFARTALGCAMTGSEAIMSRPLGLKLTDHLHGPLTVKSRSIDLTRSTLSLTRKDEERGGETTGKEVTGSALYAVSFDDKPIAKTDSLSVAYTQHRRNSHDIFGSQANDGDEDDFNEMFGCGLVDEEPPQLPILGESSGLRLKPRREFCADGEELGASTKTWREPKILKDISNTNKRSEKRAAASAGENQRPKKKASPPTKPAAPVCEGDIVVVRTCHTPISWPAVVERVFHFPTNQVSGYRVRLFGIKEVEDVAKTKVNILNETTYQKYARPSLKGKAKAFQIKFPIAFAEALQAAEEKGVVFSSRNRELGDQNEAVDKENVV